MLDNPIELIKKIHEAGMKAGVAVKPKTDIKDVFEAASIADMILVMTVGKGSLCAMTQIYD